jgi:hypothetical protein
VDGQAQSTHQGQGQEEGNPGLAKEEDHEPQLTGQACNRPGVDLGDAREPPGGVADSDHGRHDQADPAPPGQNGHQAEEVGQGHRHSQAAQGVESGGELSEVERNQSSSHGDVQGMGECQSQLSHEVPLEDTVLEHPAVLPADAALG